jgi:hypothetical protein
MGHRCELNLVGKTGVVIHGEELLFFFVWAFIMSVMQSGLW